MGLKQTEHFDLVSQFETATTQIRKMSEITRYLLFMYTTCTKTVLKAVSYCMLSLHRLIFIIFIATLSDELLVNSGREDGGCIIITCYYVQVEKSEKFSDLKICRFC